MNISTVKTENGNVSCETQEGTVVHININQRSALDCLLDTFRFFQDLKKNGQKTKPSHLSGSASHLGFGVAYVSLGLVSVMLAIILCVVKPDLGIFYSGVHFWVGFPFLVSGALNLVAYKFPKRCWMTLAFISVLVNFGVSVAGMVVTVNDFSRYWYGYYDQLCDDLRNGRTYYDRETMPPPSYKNEYDLSRCKREFQKYMTLQSGFETMTLVLMIWGLCLVILHVGSRVKSFCSSCKLAKTEEKDDALLKHDPADDVIA